MKIETGEIITLDNNKEYICCSTINDNGNYYLYLISNFKPLEVVFAKQLIEDDSSYVTIINKKEEKEYVLKLFQEQKNK